TVAGARMAWPAPWQDNGRKVTVIVFREPAGVHPLALLMRFIGSPRGHPTTSHGTIADPCSCSTRRTRSEPAPSPKSSCQPALAAVESARSARGSIDQWLPSPRQLTDSRCYG